MSSLIQIDRSIEATPELILAINNAVESTALKVGIDYFVHAICDRSIEENLLAA